MTSSDFIGDDFEQAYASVFKGAIVGGISDNGHDVAVPGFGFVQVKASVKGLYSFLKESLRRRQFIPVCVGEPGTRVEMFKTLKEFGGWVGKEIPHRLEVLSGIAKVRDLCK